MLRRLWARVDGACSAGVLGAVWRWSGRQPQKQRDGGRFRGLRAGDGEGGGSWGEQGGCKSTRVPGRRRGRSYLECLGVEVEGVEVHETGSGVLMPGASRAKACGRVGGRSFYRLEEAQRAVLVIATAARSLVQRVVAVLCSRTRGHGWRVLPCMYS